MASMSLHSSADLSGVMSGHVTMRSPSLVAAATIGGLVLLIGGAVAFRIPRSRRHS